MELVPGGTRRARSENMTSDKTAANGHEPHTGGVRVKRGLAEMLKGGVIMDVVTPEQAKIAQEELHALPGGGNDALRGGNLDATRDNLDAMVKAVLTARAKPLIVGMQVPPNYGAAYSQRFASLFVDVAKANRVPVVPFVFEGFGDDVAQFQPDRLHPLAAAEPRILDNVWPRLVPLLSRR